MLTAFLFLIACDNASEPEAQDAVQQQEQVEQAPEAANHHEEPHEEPAEATALSADEWTHYGAPFALTEVRTANEVLGNPAQFVDQTVLVEGKVTDVCQKAGCWMVITDDERTMRVLMQDHAFAVDKGGTGAHCRVEGQIIAKPVDPEEVAHFASESADAENLPEHEATDNIVYQLVASGVEMKRAAEG